MAGFVTGRINGNEKQTCLRCVPAEAELAGAAEMKNKLVSVAPAGCF